MSYDLFFLRSPEAGPLAPDEVYAYFAKRPHYQIQREAQQAFYSNEHTGVYFAFEVGRNEDEDDRPDTLIEAGVTFYLNYFRPHVFALEAERELTAFVQHFGLAVEDPQVDGMGRGDYSPEGFFKGWNAGNAVGVRTGVAQNVVDGSRTLPSAELERIWRWNMESEALQRTLGEDIFVPHIKVGLHQGRVVTFVAWADAIPMALPTVDYSVFVRMRYSKRRWLGIIPGKPELVPVPWNELAGVLGQAEVKGDPATGGYYMLRTDAAVRAAQAQFKGRASASMAIEGLAMADVLDAELVAASGAR